MKSKYELTISSNYVKSWTYLEAVREFFQNAIDEENSNPDHYMDYHYDIPSGTLVIQNRNSAIDVKSLLLGETSKSDGQSIGSFGEGYKIGILVLLREGKSVTINNGHDLWETRLVSSRKFKSQIPVIEVTKNKLKHNSNFEVCINNITSEEFSKITNNTLRLREYTSISTPYGELLTEDSEKGRIYVGGLFICEDFELKYGYNINPKYIQLNRDRNMVSSFDLIWNTSRIIANAYKNDFKKLIDVIGECKDTNYIDSFLDRNNQDNLANYWKEVNGDKIPVSTQEEYDYFKSRGMNPVIVKENLKKVISSGFFDDYREYEESESLYNKLVEHLEGISVYIDNDEGSIELDKIFNLVNDYRDDLSKIKYEGD